MRDGSLITLTPTLDTAIYADADVLFVPVELQNVVLDTKGLAKLRTLVVQDLADQKQAIDLLFFTEDPGNLGAANAALAMSDAEFGPFIGHVRVAAADYVSGNANAYATKQLDMLLGAKVKSKSLWVAGVVRSGTPTYAADSLTLKFLWEQI